MGGYTQTSSGIGDIYDQSCHHVAVTRSNDTLKFYLDGSYVSQVVNQYINSLINSSSNLFLGCDSMSGNTLGGFIDEFRFWKVARTASQISTYKDSILNNLTSNLIAYYRFKETYSTQYVIDGSLTNNLGYLGFTTAVETYDPPRSGFGYSQCSANLGSRKSYVVPTMPNNPNPNFLVYPNPFSEDLNLVAYGNKGEKSLIKIFDLQGNTKYVGYINNNEVSEIVNDFSPGVYIISIINNSFQTTSKVIKTE